MKERINDFNISTFLSMSFSLSFVNSGQSLLYSFFHSCVINIYIFFSVKIKISPSLNHSTLLLNLLDLLTPLDLLTYTGLLVDSFISLLILVYSLMIVYSLIMVYILTHIVLLTCSYLLTLVLLLIHISQLTYSC